ncbi:unnamed protein product [Prorocentrum cordatum]|uniref:Folate receptor-like domain-containing protein n=1 Tax=Prorocentrum cordatum TaxID=2364126 RepID=A0ABN9QAD7_9DINO|nr:unnamed protein product [Polarella glacialis]
MAAGHGMRRLAAVLLASGVAAQDTTTATSTSAEVVEPTPAPSPQPTAWSIADDGPLCGVTTRPLTEDPQRRFCFKQCRVERDGTVRPKFKEWVDYCEDTAVMEDWDEECKAFFACKYGCEVWGGDRGTILDAQAEDRTDVIQNTEAEMYIAGMTQEKKCILEKCNSYCAREAFGSCKEAQFQQECDAGNYHLFGCDIDCSTAAPLARHALAAAAALALLAGVLAPPPS